MARECPYGNVRSLSGRPITLSELQELPKSCFNCIQIGYQQAWKSNAIESIDVAPRDVYELDLEATFTTYSMDIVDARRRAVVEAFKLLADEEVTLTTTYYQFDCGL
jgi:hypothetical protein